MSPSTEKTNFGSELGYTLDRLPLYYRTRRHIEGSNSNKGNDRKQAEVIAQYDDLLPEHFQSSSVFTVMFKLIQSDLISAIVNSNKSKINQELDPAPFFSWWTDETRDISFRSWISVIVRYVDQQGTIQESFLFFFCLEWARCTVVVWFCAGRDIRVQFRRKTHCTNLCCSVDLRSYWLAG